MSETKPKAPAEKPAKKQEKPTAKEPTKEPAETKPKAPAEKKDTIPKKRAAGEPNIPSFDYDPKTGKPNLMEGEEVLAEVERDGVKSVVTNMGRKIFCCSIADYEDKLGLLTNRSLWEKHFPQAAK